MPDEQYFESLADRKIREAIEAGAFDDLPTGPTPGTGRAYEAGWWHRDLMARMRVDDAVRSRLEALDARLLATASLEESPMRAEVTAVVAEWQRLTDEHGAPPPPDAASVEASWRAIRRSLRRP